jgi:glycosyltransferase involved in cell wall biosynthesis
VALRLDYVSPLPPVRSGIADYSTDLLPHLEARSDLRVVRLPEQPVAPEVVARYHPVPAAEAGAGGRLPLYQMGNNRYHEGVLRLARSRPGVLTLHDLVLHHQLLDMTLGRSHDLGPYEDWLRQDHGWIGAAVARAKLWGAFGQLPTFALPAHRTLLWRQRGVLVHNRWAAEQVRAEDPAIRVRAVPMAVPLPAPVAEEPRWELRRRLGIGDGEPVLGVYGFQTPMKRAAVVMRALAAPALARAHLLVVGEVAPELDLPGLAAGLGVAGRVHLTGYVGFAELETAIAAADVCVNLRYPTAGETSASLLRILALGRPAVVSAYAQFAELPREVVLQVPLGDGEVEALAAVLGDLLRQPERLAAMGAAARDHVAREHDPGRAAEAILAACREWREAPPPGPAPLPLPPPTSLAWSHLGGTLAVRGAEAPWPPGERRRLAVELANGGPAVWKAGRSGAGGVALEVTWGGSGGGEAEGPWVPLPRDLAPGESCTLEVTARRPPGRSRLVVEPHVLGAGGFHVLGGPVWERAVE